MKYTLLELVQDILSSMSSDEVNSIDDTVESQQVAKIVRSTYFDLVNILDLKEQNTHFNLTASGDSDQPVLMTLPSNIMSVEWIKYNIETATDTDMNYQSVKELPFSEFMSRMHMLNESDSDVSTFTYTADSYDLNVLYRNDTHPRFYTNLNDNLLLFDAFDSSLESTLQQSKTLGYGRLSKTFVMSDSFVPPFDEPQHQLLLNEAKALAWAELRQTQHMKAERTARQQKIAAQKTKNAFSDPFYQTLPNYGRK